MIRDIACKIALVQEDLADERDEETVNRLLRKLGECSPSMKPRLAIALNTRQRSFSLDWVSPSQISGVRCLNSAAAGEHVLNWPDSLFQRPMNAQDMERLTSLRAEEGSISNLTGLEYAARLTKPGLGQNQISDISPLVVLTRLNPLWLSDNQIRDVLPLVNNPGLSQGDHVYLPNNPLSSTSINTYIPQLQARGVAVYWP